MGLWTILCPCKAWSNQTITRGAGVPEDKFNLSKLLKDYFNISKIFVTRPRSWKCVSFLFFQFFDLVQRYYCRMFIVKPKKTVMTRSGLPRMCIFTYPIILIGTFWCKLSIFCVQLHRLVV